MQSSPNGDPENSSKDDLDPPERKRRCSVAPNCGYLEIRSKEKTHCKRRTCNYFWLTLEPRDSKSGSVSNLTNSIVDCCTDIDDEDSVGSDNKIKTDNLPGSTPRNSEASDESKTKSSSDGSSGTPRTPRNSEASDEPKSNRISSSNGSTSVSGSSRSEEVPEENKNEIGIRSATQSSKNDMVATLKTEEHVLSNSRIQNLSEQQLTKSFSQFVEEEYTPKVAAKPTENQPQINKPPTCCVLAAQANQTPQESKEEVTKSLTDIQSKKLPTCCMLAAQANQTPQESKEEVVKSLTEIQSKTEAKPKWSEREIIKQEPSKHETKPNYCVAETCKKLNVDGFKKTKTCCNSVRCVLNDLDSNTYKFITDVRMCCKKKACQLAAKICDIYEPLVKVDVKKSDDTGDSKYHYWGKDDSTAPREEEQIQQTVYQPLNLELKKEESGNPIPNPKSSITLEELYTKPAHEQEEDNLRESVFIDPDRRNEKRTSTVSWSVPNGPSNSMMKPSDSELLLVVQAREAANMFRQAQQPALDNADEKNRDKPTFFEKTGSVVDYRDNSRDLAFKSQLDTIHSNSDYQTKCCSSLRNKLKRKKKRPKSSPSLHWAYNADTDRKRPHIEDPVGEQQIVLNDMLNRV